MDEKELDRIVDVILHKWLGASGLRSFRLENGEDNEGDPAIFVNVVLDGKQPIDPESLLRVTRQIRDELYKHNDPRLPYIRLDFPDAHHEAAE